MKYFFFSISIAFGTLLPLSAQDLFSYESTKKFANYLFTKGEFDFAAEEYERLLFLSPDKDSILVRLSQSYRKLEKFEAANQLFSRFRASGMQESWVEHEYIATLLFQKIPDKFEEGLSILQHTSNELKLRSQIEFAMLTRDWEKASLELEEPQEVYPWMVDYRQTVDNVQAFRPKKPWLAATYSALLPGSGKVYAKNTKEGITSFFFVTALGYQSYRAFKKRGTKTVSGWLYGGLSLGFYLGNIYGAQQSAKNYNRRKLEAIYHEVDQTIYNRY
jgi:tetratricopeptide (TPR) repeat protein